RPALSPRPPSPPRSRWIWVLAALGAIVVVLVLRFAVQVHEFQTLHAEGPEWGFPSRIYSAGLALIPGRMLPPAYLRAELAARGYAQVSGPPPRAGTWSLAPGGAEIFLRGFLDSRDPLGHGGPERVRVWLNDSELVAVRRLGGVAGAPPPPTASEPRLEPGPVTMMLGGRNVRRTRGSLS